LNQLPHSGNLAGLEIVDSGVVADQGQVLRTLFFKTKMIVCGELQAMKPPTISEPPSMILMAASVAEIIGFTIIASSFI